MSNDRAREALDALTAQVIDAIEHSPGKWTKPWTGVGLPANGVTGKPYRGTNILLLTADALERGYASNRWATYRQWAAKDCQVRKGEKSSIVVFYKQVRVPDEQASPDPTTGERPTKRIPLLRYSSVFAAEQVEGEFAERLLNPPQDGLTLDERAEKFFAAVGADLRFGGDSAFYTPGTDTITLPPRDAFTSTEGHYATVAHEHVHWTGGPTRLDRIKHKRFGDDPYAREELVAELGAVFVCAHLGVTHEPDPRQAAYLAHWSQHLRQNPRDLWSTVGEASAALDLLLERAGEQHHDEGEEEA